MMAHNGIARIPYKSKRFNPASKNIVHNIRHINPRKSYIFVKHIRIPNPRTCIIVIISTIVCQLRLSMTTDESALPKIA